MSDPAAPPIIVDSSPTADQLASAFRSVVLALAAAATALGLAHAGTLLGTVATFAGPVGMIAALVMSQLHATHDHARKVAMAAAAPNSVAVVR